LLGAVGGVLVDRYDRLRLLTGIQFLCCLPVFGLVFIYFAGMLQFWHIVALEALLAIIRSMNPTAGQSILRDLVPEEELMSAVSLYSIGFNFARIVGPSIGGVLILLIGVGGCLVFYGVCLLISAVEFLGIQLRSSAGRRGRTFCKSLPRAALHPRHDDSRQHHRRLRHQHFCWNLYALPRGVR
jgi:MFS family permease